MRIELRKETLNRSLSRGMSGQIILVPNGLYDSANASQLLS